MTNSFYFIELIFICVLIRIIYLLKMLHNAKFRIREIYMKALHLNISNNHWFYGQKLTLFYKIFNKHFSLTDLKLLTIVGFIITSARVKSSPIFSSNLFFIEALLKLFELLLISFQDVIYQLIFFSCL